MQTNLLLLIQFLDLFILYLSSFSFVCCWWRVTLEIFGFPLWPWFASRLFASGFGLSSSLLWHSSPSSGPSLFTVSTRVESGSLVLIFAAPESSEWSISNLIAIGGCRTGTTMCSDVRCGTAAFSGDCTAEIFDFGEGVCSVGGAIVGNRIWHWGCINIRRTRIIWITISD